MPLVRLSVELVLGVTAALGTVVALMLAAILLRRLRRQRYFRARDQARQRLQGVIDSVLRGLEVPLDRSLSELERDVLESVLLAKLEEDPKHAAAAVRFLERYGFVDRHVAQLGSRSHWVRAQAALTLGRLRSAEAVDALIAALDDRHSDVRLAAVRSLALLASPAAAPPLIEFLRRGAPGVPGPALAPALAACCQAAPDPLLLLEVLGESSETHVRIVAATALAEISSPMIRGQLEQFLFDAEPEVRARMATAIGRLRDWAAVNALVGLVDDPVWYVRLRAVQALGEIGDWRSLPALLKAVQDENWQVRAGAAHILGQLEWAVVTVIESVEHSGDRYALESLLSELERAGLIWKAIGLVLSEDPSVRRNAQVVLAAAIRGGALRAALHAVETFPEPEIVLEVAHLLRQHVRPEDLPTLQALARSPGVAPPVARILREARVTAAPAEEPTEPKPARS